MDIKEKIEELVEKITSDDKLISKFQKDPVSAIEGLLGVDPVSYTHLDVYKRQIPIRPFAA